MNMFAQTDLTNISLNFTKDSYEGREIISMTLPDINYSGKPSIYLSQYTPFIKYDPKDIKVVINRGQLVSGILDKTAIGEESHGTIFHIINNEFGPEVTLKIIYNLQQITSRFFLYYGFTTGIRDINISQEAMDKVKYRTKSLIVDSQTITDTLNARKLIPPIGTKLNDYYESLQIESLNQGDDFVEPIFGDIDFESNSLMRMVATGSKGKMTDIIAMNAALGSQLISGFRPLRNFSWGRTSPYFSRYDTDPRSIGYIANSYREGIESDQFPFATCEARQASISNALSTSITGHQNRLSVKNLETLIVDNLRKSSKSQVMIQPLYAETGIDPRKTETVYFPTIKISDAEMYERFHTHINEVPQEFRNKDVEKHLDSEYEQLVVDRNRYRQIFLDIEDNGQGQVLLSESQQLPFNILRIMTDITYEFKNEIQELETGRISQDSKIDSFSSKISLLKKEDLIQKNLNIKEFYLTRLKQLIRSKDLLKIYHMCTLMIFKKKNKCRFRNILNTRLR